MKWIFIISLLSLYRPSATLDLDTTTGKYPKAIDISGSLLLLHSLGVEKGTVNDYEKIDFTPIGGLSADLHTDALSNLFRLNDNYLILVGNTPLTVVSIEGTTFASFKLTTGFTNAKDVPYHYAIISGTEFAISFVTQIVKFQCDDKGVITQSGLATIVGAVGDSSCDYSQTLAHFICGYKSAFSVIYDLYNLGLTLVRQVNAGSGTNTFVKRITETSFATCYVDSNVFTCDEIILNNATPPTITSTVNKKIYIQSDIDSDTYNMNIMVLERSIFILIKQSNNLIFSHLTKSFKIIGENFSNGSGPSHFHPFLYSIGKSVAGFAYYENNLITLKSFFLPICTDQANFVSISNNGSIKVNLNAVQNVAITLRFSQFPRNAILKQNNLFVDENTIYTDFNFNYQTFQTTGKGTWQFFGYNKGENRGSELCELTLDMCYPSCSKCDSSQLADITNHHCEECLSPNHFYKESTKNCYNKDTIEEDYYLDVDTYKKCDASCQTCTTKDSCKICKTGYFPIEDDITKCFNTSPNKYFFDTALKMYRACYKTCESCDKLGTDEQHNCIACIADYIVKDKKCVKDCPDKWFMELGEIDCLADCTGGYDILIHGTTECVKSCSPYNNKDCIPCQEKSWFKSEDGKECITKCPAGFTEKYPDHICEKDGGGSIPPLDPNNPPNTRLKLYIEEDGKLNCPLDHTDSIQYYLDLKKKKEASNKDIAVDLILHCIGLDYSISYFLLTEADIITRVYEKYNVTQINFTSILNEITLPFNTFVMQIDVNRNTELTNQTEYLLFDITGKILDDEIASIRDKPINIISPLHDASEIMITNGFSMAKKNIDVFNQSSPFYNDICFKFTTDNGRDMIIKDRQSLFYPTKELCQANCKYSSVNYVDGKIVCVCPFEASFSLKIEPSRNPPTTPFAKKDYETYTVVKCANSVFVLNDILKNVSFWIFLSFCVAIIVLAFCFICTGLTYANKYILDVLKASNQLSTNQNILPNPPKSKEDLPANSQDQSFHTHIEEENFNDVKVNNYQKKESHIHQNYVNGETSNQKDKNAEDKERNEENSLISKLRDSMSADIDGNSLDLRKYYFTRNSENESNPNYSIPGGVETGKSYTNKPIDTNLIKSKLLYADGDNLYDMKEKDFAKKLKDHNSKVLLSEHIGIRKRDPNDSHEIKSNVDVSKMHLFEQFGPIEVGYKTENTPNKHMQMLNFDLLNRNKDIGNQSSDRDKAKSNSPLIIGDMNLENRDDDINVEVKTPNSFCRAYFNYSKKREIFFMTFCSNKSYLPFFITFPIFLFCLATMFTVHALFFTNSFIHLRYIEEGKITAGFWFKNELFKCFYSALICNLVKILIIKLLVFFVFRIEKKMISAQNYQIILQRLRCRSATIFVILILLMGLMFYINTCYSGIFVNTELGLYIGYLVSIAFSFIIAMVLCLIINIIRLMGTSCNCK